MRPRLFLYYTVAIAAFAFGLRLVFFAEMAGHPAFTLIFSDSLSYDLWARKIAGGNWIGSEIFYQAPLYPYLLGVLYRLFGANPLVVRLLQAALGALSCILVARAGRNFFSPTAGLLAAVILALYPTAIFFDGLVQKASLDLFLVSLLLLLLSRLATGAGPAAWFATGTTLGALILNRENAVLLLPLPLLWLAFPGRALGRRARSAQGIAFFAGLVLLLLPVGLRNLAVGGEFLPTTSQLGPNLFIGNNPLADGTYKPLVPGHDDPLYERADALALAERELGKQLTPGEVSRFWTGKVVDYVVRQPLSWIKLMAVKVFLAVNRVEVADAYDQYSFGDWTHTLGFLNPILHWGILAPLAVLGLVLTWPERKKIWLLYGFLFLYGTALVLFAIFARYRHPLTPALILFAAAGTTRLIQSARRIDRRLLAAGVVAAALAALISNWPLRSDLVAAGRATMRNNIGAEMMKRDNAYREALPYLTDAVRIAPYASAYENLALALRMTGRKEEAALYLRKAFDLAPTSTDLAMALGSLNLELNRYGEAAVCFRRAVGLDPLLAWAHYNLGRALSSLGQMEEARRSFREARRLDPRFPGTF